jgi:hypothetical protein
MEPKETLKSLRAKAKELRSKVSSAPISKATPDQLRSEILMLERAVKAEQKALEKKAAKEGGMAQKKKTTVVLKPVVQKTMEEREKELLKRERQMLKKEKLMAPKPQDTDSD